MIVCLSVLALAYFGGWCHERSRAVPVHGRDYLAAARAELDAEFPADRD